MKAPWKAFGEDLDPKSVDQLERACELPISVRGALMPDAHVGYGLPIGGVLATENAVIPYAVGVDIACRMKLSVFDLELPWLVRRENTLIRAIDEETRFGIGSQFRQRRDHPVLEEDWNVSPVTARHRDKAWAQLGTSGSGNHFVEFGELEVFEHPRRSDRLTGVATGGSGWSGGESESASAGRSQSVDNRLPLSPGNYLALLSHSGSRGVGASVCSHYSQLARKRHPELDRQHSFLAWLDLDSSEGREYWAAMELMGRYASANHALIHRYVAENLGAQIIAGVENHHNFAWIERHNGRRVVVHRKGATPAGAGVLGIIPGSMADPGYVVRGKGEALSLRSAAHGAGRVMSRKQAHKTYHWKAVRPFLEERGVKVLSAGIDEVPMVYKNIHTVMAAQSGLIDVLARFTPRLVKMAPAGEHPED